MRSLLLSQEIQCGSSLNFAREVGLALVRILHFCNRFCQKLFISTTTLYSIPVTLSLSLKFWAGQVEREDLNESFTKIYHCFHSSLLSPAFCFYCRKVLKFYLTGSCLGSSLQTWWSNTSSDHSILQTVFLSPSLLSLIRPRKPAPECFSFQIKILKWSKFPPDQTGNFLLKIPVYSDSDICTEAVWILFETQLTKHLGLIKYFLKAG